MKQTIEDLQKEIIELRAALNERDSEMSRVWNNIVNMSEAIGKASAEIEFLKEQAS